MRDWYTWDNPTAEEIELVAGIPGAKFDFKGQKVAAMHLHRSLWNLAGVVVDYGDTSPSPSPILRNYQQQDLPWLLARRSSILGYEMRLGKTATATCAHNPKDGPLLVIAPLIARDVWRYWIEKVHGVAPVCLESKTDIPLPGFPAYFCHFDIADAHSSFLQTIKPATLIIDEIHLLQARRSLRMSTCSLIAAEAGRIIGLSGTPMWSNPKSMWPILNLLAPGAWGSEFEYCQRYMRANRGAWGWIYEGTANESEFRTRLSQIVVRRTWKEIAPQLPPTVNVVEGVAITNRERQSCELQSERTRLAKGKSYESAVAATAILRQKYGMLKIDRAVELCVQAISDGHKVVLWTWHVEVAAALDEALNNRGNAYGYRITAEQTQDQRATIINSFQSANGYRYVVVPLAVGGVAIDLSAADVNIFVEVDWIPATNYQASMRVFSPLRPHANHWLFVDVPVERRLLEVLGANESCQTNMGLGYDEIASRVLG